MAESAAPDGSWTGSRKSSAMPVLDNHSMRNNSVFWNDYNTIADVIEGVICVLRFAGGRDANIIPDTGVLIDDGIFDPGVLPNADPGLAHHFILKDRMMRLVIIASHQDDAVEFTPRTHDAADADDRMADIGRIDDAAIRDNGGVNLRAIDFRCRQKPGPTENRSAHVEEIELRQFGCAVDVRVEKRANGSDVFPIALKNIGEN